MVINSCLFVWNRLPRDWYCNQFVGHSLISDGARCLNVWGDTQRLTGGLSRVLYAWVWQGIGYPPSPRKKIVFGIDGYAISCCLEGLINCTPQSLIDDILSCSQFLPTSLYLWLCQWDWWLYPFLYFLLNFLNSFGIICNYVIMIKQ